MAAPTLNAAEKVALSSADPEFIVNTLAACSLPSGNNWLPATHAAIRGIEKDHKPGGNAPIAPLALAEYLAIATPTHCADGWSYLSRALHSYLVGDPHSAWHFAYYAELRAAQAILSSLGCGAFNSWNCTLDSAGTIRPAGTHPTHVMVWLALGFLCNNSLKASTAISAATSVLGHSLPEVIQYAYPGQRATSTSANWLGEWLFDLETGIDDKAFRNKCSYNPHVVTAHRANVGESVELVCSLWEALEPSPGAAFLEIDKHILRSALRKAAVDHLLLKNSTRPPTEAEQEEELREAHMRICAGAPTFASIPAEFIANVVATDHPLLHHAKDYSSAPDTPRPVLTRAALLLRVASGMAMNLFRDAGQSTNLGFWLDDLAERQGIVSNRSEIPTNRSELYLDCAIASEALERRYAGGLTSLAALMSHREVKSHLVSQAERVVQWGILP